ncbi:asparagine synthetase AsnA [Spiroplasma sabaudiense Ar-1343]|uniref:Asparagine synthetase AsnA n=1 Tax=Spiroplasma sabaudiense Ar-1343 TaxID=1276257 RepID=W6A8Y9_9MOLU|nr:hypothetical protein [Spiroplasma sabaudiense]AHI53431.1 asparagine synthetase AsnA [Spiroplasma sabaudiense Ar-1343]
MKYGISLGYSSKLDKLETIKGISEIKKKLKTKLIEKNLLLEINPAIVTNKSLWLNDDFQGTQRAIDFDILEQSFYGELLQSNNKYRRYLLMKNDLKNVGDGFISDFSCVKRDVKTSNTISNVYDEIGFEIVVNNYDSSNLNEFVVGLYSQILMISDEIKELYPKLQRVQLSNELTFISFTKLKSLYPFLSFRERLNRFGRENGSFALTNFVKKLFNSKELNNFSEDVFDFNSYIKLYAYNSITETSISIAYIGYSVDREILQEQNRLLKENFKTKTGFNHLVTTEKLPLTLTGGIFLSKLTMLILEKNHIAEVQSSIWPKEFEIFCQKNNINIF